jgi:hypothetical protein
MIRNFCPDGAEPEFLTLEEHERARGTGKRVIVYGEQGIGDELMMGSMLFDARRDYEVIFECHPRLEALHRRAHPGITIYPTRKDEWIDWPVTDNVRADFKCSIADLGLLYRRERSDFDKAWAKDGPFYAADENEASSYRELLQELAGGRKIIGLATRGGVIRTMRWYRSLDVATLEPLLADKRFMFVSFDYEDVEVQCAQINARYGDGTIYNFPAVTQHWDYEHTAALVAATDAVVTPCQSVAHLSSGMGHPTLVLTPSKPAWRYGCTEERFYWYPGAHATLYRQRGEDWRDAVTRAHAALGRLT